ncbi:MAG: ComEC/Rec2 family competence protein [Faecalibacterium sp.]|nr:ComEC/Rec2 family competence protein [Ruminococcus sp.]MCM1391571.1 ComEC/Rec2 family competence protein [Ruminococcus sp.]MCM1485128.1 ComEC/Rec2 family competence protein [Faecalibacterium sp.]
MLILSTVSMMNKKLKQSAWLKTIFVTAMAGCFLFTFFEAYHYYPALKLTGENVQITAIVTDYPVPSDNRYYVNANLETVNGSRQNAKIRLSFAAYSKYDENLELILDKIKPNDTVSFNGTIYTLGGDDESIHRHFKSRGVYLGAYPTGIVSMEVCNHKSLSFTIKHERQKVINQLRSSFDSDTAGFLISILLGEKAYIDDSTYSDFKSAGVAHIMAVSGLHLSIWVLFIMNIISKAGLDKRKYALMLICFVLIIMGFTCFSGSVMRAGIMMIVYLCGFVIRKTPDSLNSLGFAAIVVLLINPYSCVNISFLLSFLSTLAIIVLAIPISEKLTQKIVKPHQGRLIQKISTVVIQSISISVSVSLFTFPVTVSVFGCVSTMTVIANLILLPLTMPLILCAGLYVMFYFIPIVSHLLHFAAEILVKISTLAIHAVAAFPYSTFAISESALPFVLTVYFGLTAIVLICLYNRKKHNRLSI